MVFPISFGIGSAGVFAIYALARYGGEAGGVVMALVFTLGGLISAIVAVACLSKGEPEIESNTLYQRRRYEVLSRRREEEMMDAAVGAGLTSPLGMAWLGVWIYQIFDADFSIGQIIGIAFFGIWFLIIALGSLDKLLNIPQGKVGAGVLASVLGVAGILWFMTLPSAAERVIIAKFEKEHCITPGGFASVEKYTERIAPCPNCIGHYDLKHIKHERLGDRMVICRVDTRVAQKAACAAKGQEVVWRRNAIQTSLIPWSAENYHKVCSGD